MKFLNFIKSVCVVTSFAFIAAPSSAATVTFDLSGNLAPTNHSFELTQSGVTAVFEAFTFDRLNFSNNTISDAGTSLSESNVGRYNGGVGVSNAWWDSHTIDSANGIDFIQVTLLTGALAINNISFGYVFNNYDDFRWMWDESGDGAIGGGDFISDRADITASGSSYANMGSQISNVFGFAAANDPCGYHCSNASFWKLETVSFDIAAVPLPNTLLMLMAALAGLVVLRNRKTA